MQQHLKNEANKGNLFGIHTPIEGIFMITIYRYYPDWVVR